MAAGTGSPGCPPADDGLAAAPDAPAADVAGALLGADAPAEAAAVGWAGELAGPGVAAELQPRRLDHDVARRRLQLDAVAQLLESFDYRRVLDRGFVLVRNAAGQPVLTAAAVAPGAALTLQFADAAITAVAAGRPLPAAPKSSDAAGRKQGSLF